MSLNNVSWEMGENRTEKTNFVLIHSLYVTPAERGRGVARRLLSQAIAEIRKTYPGLPIEIDAHKDEEITDLKRLVAFYQDMGFKIVDTVGDTVWMRMG